MNKSIVIFGTGKIAEVVYYYAVQECGLTVAAFCIDALYKNTDQFFGLPVVNFEEVEDRYPPGDYDMFVAIGYHDLNRLREARCNSAMQKGYKLVSVVSPLANLPANVEIGYNCFIMPPAIVHPCVVFGNNVFVWSGSVVGHHSVIQNNCWLTSSCNISGNVSLGENSFVAVNATIGHSVLIGKNCFIGANALVTKNLAEERVVIVESTKPFRLNSKQFLRFSNFSSL